MGCVCARSAWRQAPTSSTTDRSKRGHIQSPLRLRPVCSHVGSRLSTSRSPGLLGPRNIRLSLVYRRMHATHIGRGPTSTEGYPWSSLVEHGTSPKVRPPGTSRGPLRKGFGFREWTAACRVLPVAICAVSEDRQPSSFLLGTAPHSRLTRQGLAWLPRHLFRSAVAHRQGTCRRDDHEMATTHRYDRHAGGG
jgi:hypothetical protein